MAYRHIVWDWNGTLIDDVWLCVDVVNAMLRERGLPLTDELHYRSAFGFPVINFYKHLGFDFGRESFEQLSVLYINAYQDRREECALYPSTREVLAAVRAAGLGQSILSAYEQAMLETLVERLDLGEFFEHLMGNDNIYAAGKVERGRMLLERIGLPASEVVMIGDTEHDHEVAKALGMDCLLLEHGHHSRERLARLGRKVLPSLEAVIAELEGGREG